MWNDLQNLTESLSKKQQQQQKLAETNQKQWRWHWRYECIFAGKCYRMSESKQLQCVNNHRIELENGMLTSGPRSVQNGFKEREKKNEQNKLKCI